MKEHRPQKFKAWMVFDRMGNYMQTIHVNRKDAVADRDKNKFLIDAKWIIVRVEVTP